MKDMKMEVENNIFQVRHYMASLNNSLKANDKYTKLQLLTLHYDTMHSGSAI